MRIWSLHPKYLDTKGIIALWREALLARTVLEGKTKGYRKHPQLTRFKETENPIDCINQYLTAVYEESFERGYKFDRSKIGKNFIAIELTVTEGQLYYERNHLLEKLKIRDIDRFKKLIQEKRLEPHPLFRAVKGGIEKWEIMKT